MWSYEDRRWPRVDIAFAVLFFGLLAYNLLAWQRLFGLGPEGRPLPLIAVSAGLLLSSLASVARRRSRRLFYALVVLSMAAVAISLAAL